MYLVDDEDKKIVEKYRWHNHNGYMRTTINKKKVYMHRLIISHYGFNWGIVDHINWDKSDNRKCNLRESTKILNGLNRKNSVGVRKTRSGKYQAYIKIKYVQRNLGVFETFEEAREAYINFRKRIHQKDICNL